MLYSVVTVLVDLLVVLAARTRSPRPRLPPSRLKLSLPILLSLLHLLHHRSFRRSVTLQLLRRLRLHPSQLSRLRLRAEQAQHPLLPRRSLPKHPIQTLHPLMTFLQLAASRWRLFRCRHSPRGLLASHWRKCRRSTSPRQRSVWLKAPALFTGKNLQTLHSLLVRQTQRRSLLGAAARAGHLHQLPRVTLQ